MANKNAIISALKNMDYDALIDIYHTAMDWSGLGQGTVLEAKTLLEVAEERTCEDLFTSADELVDWTLGMNRLILKSPSDLIWESPSMGWLRTTHADVMSFARSRKNLDALAEWLIDNGKDTDLRLPPDLACLVRHDTDSIRALIRRVLEDYEPGTPLTAMSVYRGGDDMELEWVTLETFAVEFERYGKMASAPYHKCEGYIRIDGKRLDVYIKD